MATAARSLQQCRAASHSACHALPVQARLQDPVVEGTSALVPHQGSKDCRRQACLSEDTERSEGSCRFAVSTAGCGRSTSSTLGSGSGGPSSSCSKSFSRTCTSRDT